MSTAIDGCEMGVSDYYSSRLGVAVLHGSSHRDDKERQKKWEKLDRGCLTEKGEREKTFPLGLELKKKAKGR